MPDTSDVIGLPLLLWRILSDAMALGLIGSILIEP